MVLPAGGTIQHTQPSITTKRWFSSQIWPLWRSHSVEPSVFNLAVQFSNCPTQKNMSHLPYLLNSPAYPSSYHRIAGNQPVSTSQLRLGLAYYMDPNGNWLRIGPALPGKNCTNVGTCHHHVGKRLPRYYYALGRLAWPYQIPGGESSFGAFLGWIFRRWFKPSRRMKARY